MEVNQYNKPTKIEKLIILEDQYRNEIKELEAKIEALYEYEDDRKSRANFFKEQMEESIESIENIEKEQAQMTNNEVANALSLDMEEGFAKLEATLAKLGSNSTTASNFGNLYAPILNDNELYFINVNIRKKNGQFYLKNVKLEKIEAKGTEYRNDGTIRLSNGKVTSIMNVASNLEEAKGKVKQQLATLATICNNWQPNEAIT